MLEFYDDLTPKQRTHPFRFIVGAISLLLAFIWLFGTLQKEGSMPLFAIVFFLFLLVNGLWHALEGAGVQVNRIFGNACIRINEEMIFIKGELFGRAVTLPWHLVKSITLKPYRVEVLDSQGQCMEFDFSRLDFKQMENLKQILRTMAQKKEIGVVDH
ncbi:MAG: hypothetical protein R6U66_01990 [Bacteroidales bacterium]